MSQQPAPAADWAPYLERCFLFEAAECAYQIEGIAGQVPDWLKGSYYVNGPACFRRGRLRYRHWLDGDGMVYALHFGDRVRFAGRFVRTRKFQDEQAAGRPLYRTFGTAFPGDRLLHNLMLESTANVSVFPFAGKLLAFGEQALPYELDPLTLETLGEYDFEGRLTRVSPFAAHPKFDPQSGSMFNFGISFSARQPALAVYEFDAAGSLKRRRRVAVDHQYTNHDFGISPNFVVFYLSPLIMNFERFFRENVSVMESLRWEPEKGSRLLIIPRQGGEPFQLKAGQAKALHFINCFEEEGFLVVDVLELERPVYPEYETVPDLYSDVSPCRPVRYRVNASSCRLLDRTALDYDRSPDFPSIDRRRMGQPYDAFWMLGISCSGRFGRKFFDQLARGDWSRGGISDIFQSRPGYYLAGEPVFVPRPGGRREGVVIVQGLNAAEDRAEWLLFDAFNLAAGPVARLPLRHRVHPAFHASFLPRGEA